MLLSLLSVARDVRLVRARTCRELYSDLSATRTPHVARGARRWRRFLYLDSPISALGCCPGAFDRWITWPLPCLSSPTTTRTRPWLWQRSKRPFRKSCASSRGIFPSRREKRWNNHHPLAELYHPALLFPRGPAAWMVLSCGHFPNQLVFLGSETPVPERCRRQGCCAISQTPESSTRTPSATPAASTPFTAS